MTYKGVYKAHGKVFPEDPLEQLRLAICAVFDSWQSDRAIKYMQVQQITGLLGTAVNVQVMLICAFVGFPFMLVLVFVT